MDGLNKRTMCTSSCGVGRDSPLPSTDDGHRSRKPEGGDEGILFLRSQGVPTFERLTSLSTRTSTEHRAAVCARQELVALTNGAHSNSCTFGARRKEEDQRTTPSPTSSSSSGSQDFVKYDDDFAAACLGLQSGEGPHNSPKKWRVMQSLTGGASAPLAQEQQEQPTPLGTTTSMRMRKVVNRRMCKIIAECNDILTATDKVKHVMQAPRGPSGSPASLRPQDSAATSSSEKDPAVAFPARQSPKTHIRPPRHVASIMRDASLYSSALATTLECEGASPRARGCTL